MESRFRERIRTRDSDFLNDHRAQRACCAKVIQGFSKDKLFDEALKERHCRGYMDYEEGLTLPQFYQREAQRPVLRWSKVTAAISFLTLLAVLGFGIYQLIN